MPVALSEITADYRQPPLPRGTLNLSNGAPDVRLVPARLLGRAYRRALALRAPELLAYGDAAGHPALRAALASMLSATRGLSARADDVVITRGSQMALTLIARALLRPGDTIAVEQPGYRPAWEAFRAAGATVVPVRVDHDGVDVDAIGRIARATTLRAVYVTPHHQYPTTVTLKAPRRLSLLALARTRRFAIIEDDYDHEFHYDGRPVLPLAIERSRRSGRLHRHAVENASRRDCASVTWWRHGPCSTASARSGRSSTSRVIWPLKRPLPK